MKPASGVPVRLMSILLLAGLAGCAVAPSGPSLTALPGNGRSLEQFRLDDAACRRATTAALSGQTPQQAANASVAAGAVGGAAVGALAGAALGGSRGASVGAGTGLVMGSLMGSAQSPVAAQRAQFGFDQIYFQCMYRAGHRVPVNAASMQPAPAAVPYRAVPQGSAVPMPPPGLPPAPPPGLAAPAQRSVMSYAPPGVAPAPAQMPMPNVSPAVPPPPPGAPPAPPRSWRAD